LAHRDTEPRRGIVILSVSLRLRVRNLRFARRELLERDEIRFAHVTYPPPLGEAGEAEGKTAIQFQRTLL
jgi:hypothetical protein